MSKVLPEMAVPGKKPLRLFIVTGEPSGDQLAARLLERLRPMLAGRELVLGGVGGPALAGQGLQSLFPQSDISVMGVAAVVGRLRLLLKRISETAQAAHTFQPDLLLTVDSPDFCLRVTKRLRKLSPKVPIVHWVCPSVWAWRPARAKRMAPHVDHVLCLLPFEPEALQRLHGPAGTYIGHPLIERLSDLRPQMLAETTARAAKNDAEILILPGSRRSEVSRLMEVFSRAAANLSAQRPDVRYVLPAVDHVRPLIEAELTKWSVPVTVVSGEAAKLSAFRRARAALAASGTVTLELALAGVPTVAAYKVAGWEAAIARRLITVPSAILPNLIVGRSFVAEFIQQDCTPDALSSALDSLIDDGVPREAQLQGFREVEARMVGANPSEVAASVILR
ncbi:MAG: lipid-A-disaccharide synthase, partial [Bosea sp. (in: a-proteobacteria)]